jgi:3-hexulose-6-phosphate synthase/6-phospho-3-hexuloisomerase
MNSRRRQAAERGAEGAPLSPSASPGGAPSGAVAAPCGDAHVTLQVALDFVDLPRAIAVAREAVAGGCDWVEAGTPLIKAEGLNAVRELKAAFPDKTIVADMKTMDAGRVEVEYAAKAGAGVVGVLGAASDSTIKECAEAARNYGCKLIVDMIEVADPVARARAAESFGADYIGIHTAIDQQMRGEAPLEVLRRVAEAVSIPVSVAGGINSETAAAAVEAGAAIVVVGGAIIKATDAAAAAAEIRRAVDERVCIATTLYKRADEAGIRAVLEQVSTANISDAWHRQPSLHGVRPLLPGAHMCGPVVTVRTYPGDWAKPVEAIDVCRPGDVLVIDAFNSYPAIWGELATHSALVKGIAGLVVWGAIRDTPEIARLGFPAFSSLVSADAGEPKGFGEINVPVQIAGQEVKPGDWVVGDDDGVIVLPKAQAVELANRAMDVLEKENRLRGEIDAGKTLAEVAYLQKWEKR